MLPWLSTIIFMGIIFAEMRNDGTVGILTGTFFFFLHFMAHKSWAAKLGIAISESLLLWIFIKTVGDLPLVSVSPERIMSKEGL